MVEILYVYVFILVEPSLHNYLLFTVGGPDKKPLWLRQSRYDSRLRYGESQQRCYGLFMRICLLSAKKALIEWIIVAMTLWHSG